MKGSIALSLLAAGGIALAASASAQTRQPPTDADSGLPFCSAKVQDHCIQKSDLRREGKTIVTQKAAAANA